MGWLITLGILVLIACVPLGISGIYDKSGAVLQLLIGPFSILLYPQKKKKDKKKPAKKQQKSKPQTQKSKQTTHSFHLSKKVKTDIHIRECMTRIPVRAIGDI